MKIVNLIAVQIVSLWITLPLTANGETLKVATYNIGMLDVGSPVPYLSERDDKLWNAMKEFLDSTDVDVVAIQEAWTNESLVKLQLAAHPKYEVFYPQGDAWVPGVLDHVTGLAYIIKKSLKAEVRFRNFEIRESYICGFGQVCDRGALVAQMRISNRPLVILNTHLTPTIGMTSLRMAQSKEVDSWIKQYTDQNSETVVIFAGDLNVSPQIGDLKPGDDGSVSDWSENAKVYNQYFRTLAKSNLSLCDDTYYTSAQAPDYQYTQNRDTNATAKISDSTRVEPNQRIDHIFICGEKKNWLVKKNISIFHESFWVNIFTGSDGDYKSTPTQLHLSDHFGVLTEIAFQ